MHSGGTGERRLCNKNIVEISVSRSVVVDGLGKRTSSMVGPNKTKYGL